VDLATPFAPIKDVKPPVKERKVIRSNAYKAELLLDLIISGVPQKDAAKQLGVSESTISRWAKQEWFTKRVTIAKKQLMEATANKLQSVAIRAVAVLVKIAEDENSPQGPRVAAGVKIIELASKAYLTETLEQRVAELEARTNTYGESRSIAGANNQTSEDDAITIEADSD
jgi:hypothetical protein